MLSLPSAAAVMAPPAKGKGDPFFIPGDGRVNAGLSPPVNVAKWHATACVRHSSLHAALGRSTLRALHESAISALPGRPVSTPRRPHAHDVEGPLQYRQATKLVYDSGNGRTAIGLIHWRHGERQLEPQRPQRRPALPLPCVASRSASTASTTSATPGCSGRAGM